MSGPERNSRNKWTDEDDRILLELKAGGKSHRAISDILKRSVASIEQRFYFLRDRAHKQGLRRRGAFEE